MSWAVCSAAGTPIFLSRKTRPGRHTAQISMLSELGGTGLGLAIVKHSAQAHGGALWPESEPGKDTTVYFTLPEA